jgi:hypothetical protein
MKRPQALQTGRPSLSLRHSEVLVVEQFEHNIEARLSLSTLDTRESLREGWGSDSLEGNVETATVLKPVLESLSSDEEFGFEGEPGSNMSLFCEGSVK